MLKEEKKEVGGEFFFLKVGSGFEEREESLPFSLSPDQAHYR